ncbi:MAG: PAS domain S-box protein [Pseudomonadota bacterium]|nr:PAS domain S-box protein [Pseudomonadota bacterium]
MLETVDAERRNAEEAHARLAMIVDTSDDAIISTSIDGAILTWNAGAERLFGFPVEEVVGQPIARLIPLDRMPEEAQIVQRLQRGEVIEHYETVRLAKDGRRLDVSLTISPLKDAGGNVIGTSKILRDISVRKRAEIALRESEQEFRSLAEAVPQIVWATRPDGWNIYFNQRWVDYTGLTLEESHGDGWNTPFHPDDRQRAWDAWQGATQRNETYSLECRLRRADGVYRWWLVRGVPMRSANGEIQKWFGTCTDIENLKQAGEALRASEQRFRAFVTASSDAVYRVSPDWSVMRQLHDQDSIADATAPNGNWLQEYLHPDDQPLVMAVIREAIRIRSIFELEHRVRRVDGTFGWTLSRAVPLLDGSGEIVEWIGTASDVTDRKVAQDALDMLNATLEQRVLERTAELSLVNADLQAEIAANERLRESEARLLTVVEDLTEGLVIRSMEGEFIHWNRASLNMHGFASMAECLGRLADFTQLFEIKTLAGATLPLDQWPMARALRGELVRNCELRIRRTDTGVERILSYGGASVRGSVGKQSAFLIVTDIAERHEAQQELLAGKSKLEAALSSMNDAVFISDTQGRFIEFNEAFATFHRFKDKASCSQTLAEYLLLFDMWQMNGDFVPLEHRPLQRALRGESSTNVELKLHRSDTGEAWIGSYSFAPMRSQDGTIAGAVVTARDITALKHAHADLESSHAALQRLIAAHDRVQEDERGRIARELHDDLQQTLAAIRIDLGELGDRLAGDAPHLKPLAAEVDSLAAQAISSTRRIVSDLRPQMLEDLGLGAALEMLADQVGQFAGLVCEVDAAEDAVAALNESPFLVTSLFRVTQEALNNVAKHARASKVDIRLALLPTGQISLRVIDNGLGIRAQDSRKPESFGILGMRERVRAHGGHLSIESLPGGGTALEVLVPLPGARPLIGDGADSMHSAAAAPGQDSGFDLLNPESMRGQGGDTDALSRLLNRPGIRGGCLV